MLTHARVTETGWPSTGPTQNQAVASVDNAQTYWKEVACSLFASGVNTWWFELVESPTEPSVNFDVMGAASHQPSYDLSCGSSTALVRGTARPCGPSDARAVQHLVDRGDGLDGERQRQLQRRCHRGPDLDASAGSTVVVAGYVVAARSVVVVCAIAVARADWSCSRLRGAAPDCAD